METKKTTTMKQQNTTLQTSNTTDLTTVREKDVFFTDFKFTGGTSPGVSTTGTAALHENAHQKNQHRRLHSKDGRNKLFPPKGRTTQCFQGSCSPGGAEQAAHGG